MDDNKDQPSLNEVTDLNVGEGYRRINPAIDEPVDGDEYYDPESQRWFVRWSGKTDFVADTVYRRKVNA